MSEGLDEAREAFNQDIAPASPPRDQAGRFVQTSAKPEPIFQPRPVEGDELTGDTRDGGPDPRLLEAERNAADGWDQQRNEGRGQGPRRDAEEHADAAARSRHQPAAQDEPKDAGGAEADAAAEDNEEPDAGEGPEGTPVEDAGPRYEVEVDGEKRHVTLTEALRGYQREETFNTRMGQMVEVAKAIDLRGQEAMQARDAYIQMCQRQEQEFASLIPKEPANWDELYKANPQGAHELEKNFKHVYGTLNQIRQRRVAAEQEAYQANMRHTAEYARGEFGRFCSKNKLTNQVEVDRAIGFMRRTAAAHGFSEDEIGTTYDERMLSVLLKAAKYDNMVSNKPLPVQPEKTLHPGSAPRVGNGSARLMNDAQRRLASSGRVDDAAAVMAHLIRGGR